MKYYYHKPTSQNFEHYVVMNDNNVAIHMWVNYGDEEVPRWKKVIGAILNYKLGKVAIEIPEQEFNKTIFLIAL